MKQEKIKSIILAECRNFDLNVTRLDFDLDLDLDLDFGERVKVVYDSNP